MSTNAKDLPADVVKRIRDALRVPSDPGDFDQLLEHLAALIDARIVALVIGDGKCDGCGMPGWQCDMTSWNYDEEGLCCRSCTHPWAPDRNLQSSRCATDRDKEPAMETTTERPDVWDYGDSDDYFGIEGHGHTVECAQAHVDHAMVHEFGITDQRFVIRHLEDHPGGCVPGGPHQEPFTLAHGDYTDLGGGS